MIIEKINPLSDEKWLTFINQFSIATIFHHPSWLQTLSDQYNYPVFAICVKDDNGNIKAGILFCEVKSITNKKKWISLPFTDCCEILYKNEDDVEKILKYLENACKNNDVTQVEIRSHLPKSSRFKQVSQMVLHRAALNQDPEKVYEKFKSSHIRGIKKATKNNLETEVSKSEEAMDKFYGLHLITRKKLGVPVQPRRFFRYIHDHILEKGRGYIVLVKQKNKVLAASVFLFFGETVIYKYGASDPRYLHLRPNNLLFWTAMKKACLEGYHIFDLGKTDTEQSGLRRFKSGWGAQETELYYAYYPAVPENKVIDYFRDKVVSKVIKCSPKFVCRIIGELLYKYSP